MDDLTTDTIRVENGGDEFVFQVPSPLLVGRVASRGSALRRSEDPAGGGSEVGLDDFAWMLYRGMATFEVLLRKASCTWPWSPMEGGQLVIDSAKFPAGTEFQIVEVYQGFMQALSDFHRDRNKLRQSAKSETVAG